MRKMNPVVHFEMPTGGRLIEEPHEIPGIGIYVSFLDTENNRLSILQPIM